MDVLWTSQGRAVEFSWTYCGLLRDALWSSHGRTVDFSGTRCGVLRDVLWTHGRAVEFSGMRCGVLMDVRWTSQGRASQGRAVEFSIGLARPMTSHPEQHQLKMSAMSSTSLYLSHLSFL